MKTFLLTASFLAFALPALALESADKARAYINQNVAGWASDPVLVSAVLAQNARTGGLTQAEIDTLDAQWRVETGAPNSALIMGVLQNAASSFLVDRVTEAGGSITEVFMMDARGLNVAASAVTSDYWQGDEEKFSETFPKGANAMHVGDVELDESTQTYQVQVSFSLINPADGSVIGAMTVALNAESM